MVSATSVRTLEHRKLVLEPITDARKSKRCKYGKIEFRDREPIPELNFPGTRAAAVKQMERLIKKKSNQYYFEAKDCYLTPKDLLHFGQIGVLEAHARFRKSKKVMFHTYCDWWIRAIVRRNINMEKLGTPSFRDYISYKMYKNAIDAYQRGRGTASLTKREKELLQNLKSGKLKLAKAEKILHERELALLNAGQRLPSLDARVNPKREDGYLREEMIPSPSAGTDDTSMDVAKLSGRLVMNLALVIKKRWGGPANEKFRARARAIFWGRIMRESEDRIPLNVLGKEFHISRERTRQVEDMLKRDFYERMKSDPLIREIAAEHYGISIKA
ncbi:hypothetical protein H0O02_03450 [Candidatus Micrarchaeota archaeon]|nr:hypothetical protein [Candidatus Micrarchaeota archaeon]